MNHIHLVSCSSGLLTLVCVALVSMAPVILADEDASGTWELKYSIGGNNQTERLSITKGDDGVLVGKWIGNRGRSVISDLKFEKGNLTFIRKVQLGEREINVRFEGKIEGDKMTGIFIMQRGKIEVNGTRSQPETPAPAKPSKPDPIHQDVAYGPHKRNVLDIWLADSVSPTPLVLFIHGGGFRGGSKKSFTANTLQRLLSTGISVAAVEYRLISDKRLPAAHHDCRRALQFLRSRAKEWNIDKTRVGAFGGSAGAQICMWLAFHDEMADPASADPIERESTRLTCVATSGGQTTMDFEWWHKWIPGYVEPHRDPFETFEVETDQELRKIIAEISALSLVSADDPPIYMRYGQKPDDPIPTDPQKARSWKVHHVMFGVKLKEKMDELGVEANLQHPGIETHYKSQEHFFITKLKENKD